jgi:hypothetical protein
MYMGVIGLVMSLSQDLTPKATFSLFLTNTSQYRQKGSALQH